ncbi:BEM_collapsed_G0009460.mRNA.1.CDS.1 [Saccharomyces cerevisiae]|nr:BEM_collapsed_G0009460.mRNA.1.CDS.1 [Saccharomyces cerevisiae]
MAGSCMASFTGSLYGINNGGLGVNCDRSYNSSCRDVYRSRSAAFATMTWCALILAWEVVDMRRSFFQNASRH